MVDFHDHIRRVNLALKEVSKNQDDIQDKAAKYALIQLSIAVESLKQAVNSLNK